jgi:hypothetical protein
MLLLTNQRECNHALSHPSGAVCPSCGMARPRYSTRSRSKDDEREFSSLVLYFCFFAGSPHNHSAAAATATAICDDA